MAASNRPTRAVSLCSALASTRIHPSPIERPVPISARDASGFPSKEADPEGYLRAAAVLRASPWVLGGAVNSAGQIVASDTGVQVYRES